jgi:NAD(P)H-dependent flavin oxidoreductase YrpB (nitropropane dioxygenase family)
MDEVTLKIAKDCEEIEHFKQVILKATKDDVYHIDNPKGQIYTLSMMVNELIRDNENGKNNELIGFYSNIARSLKKLIELQSKE